MKRRVTTVYWSVVISAEFGIELGHVDVWTDGILAESKHRLTINIFKLTEQHFIKVEHLSDWILGTWSSIFGIH